MKIIIRKDTHQVLRILDSNIIVQEHEDHYSWENDAFSKYDIYTKLKFESEIVDVGNIEDNIGEYRFKYIDGKFEPFDENEHEWQKIREKRNELLKESDWTQLPDSPLDEFKKYEWKIYREFLRNITQQHSPFYVIFPIKPS